MNPRRIYRSHDRRLAGVAGGMAEYLGIDPTIARLLWVLAAFASAGMAVFAYIICAFIIPNPPWSRAPGGQQWYGTQAGAPPTWGPSAPAQGWGYQNPQPSGWAPPAPAPPTAATPDASASVADDATSTDVPVPAPSPETGAADAS
jgi:phage shock protein C